MSWSMRDIGLPELDYINELEAEIVTLKKQLEEANPSAYPRGKTDSIEYLYSLVQQKQVLFFNLHLSLIHI